MHEIAPGAHHIPVSPRNGVNTYLLGDVLVDTGFRTSAKGLMKALEGREVRAIALTHAHGDHGGSARRLSAELGVPVWVGARDRAATESGKAEKKSPFDRPGISSVAGLLGDFPGVAVSRGLREGDELAAGFTVLDTPGHSPGHVSYWRASDGVLICGDVFFNMHLLTTVPGLREPPGPFTFDVGQNRDSERRLAALEPSVVGFGHGPVMSDDAAGTLARFAAKLPA